MIRIALIPGDGVGPEVLHEAERQRRLPESVASAMAKQGLYRIMSSGRLDESPSFAPNGSMIIYATRVGGKGVLAAVSTDGRVQQRLRLQRQAVAEAERWLAHNFLEKLAQSEPGPIRTWERVYLAPEAAQVVGYASITMGTGGIEHAYDAELRGEDRPDRAPGPHGTREGHPARARASRRGRRTTSW